MVSTSVVGDDGYTLGDLTLSQREGAFVERNSSRVAKGRLESTSFIRVPRHTGTALLLDGDYASVVRGSNPIAYWRFENADGGVVANEVGPGHAGRISEGLVVVGDHGNRSLRFPTDVKGSFEVEEAFEGINGDSYSIEFWMNAESFERMALVSLLAWETGIYKGAPVNMHLAYLELEDMPYDLKHRPYAFRFLHRIPDIREGNNAFSESSYRPGHWHHVVAVKEEGQMSLYLDGELEKRLEQPGFTDEGGYRLLFGQIDLLRRERCFNGLVDEMAIYDRVLAPEEIRERVSRANKS